ncbi:helix-turn-helix domain-containing protein [Dactylosporangium sp. NPDC051541]|uniref:helix-turn-helix domain-containing protein n=1 Tax=Dactylosporangium sp. NPDC051541 TaxID=3363977 RepID=UPI0037B6280E
MTATGSPAGARLRLRFALRKARDAAGLTQQQVGESLHWSLSKVQRIEAGESTISLTDLAAVIRLFDLRDPAQIDQMTADARLARRRGVWNQSEYRSQLTSALLQIGQFEHEATAVRVFQPAVFPGLLQERGYANAVIGAVVDHMPADMQNARLDFRMQRQRDFFSRPDGMPLYFVILDEALPERIQGDKATMARQLGHVLDVAQRPEIRIRFLPKHEAIYLLLGAFTVYALAGDEDAAVYKEYSVTDDLIQDPDLVKIYRHRFEQMWNLCLSEQASMDLISARYATMISELSRG